MSTFSSDVLVKKLAELNNTTPSIQTLSLWLIHHRKHASTVVQTWKKEVIRAPSKKKLTMMYLANDVIQNSKKKGNEFNLAFAPELSSVYRHLGGTSLDEKTESGVLRLLNVWKERGVFTSLQISGLRAAFETGSKSPAMSPAGSPSISPDGVFKEPPPKKKRLKMLPAKSPLAAEPKKKPEDGEKAEEMLQKNDEHPKQEELHHEHQKPEEREHQKHHEHKGHHEHKSHHEHRKHHEERKRHELERRKSSEERRKSSEERRKSSEERRKPEVKEVEVEGHKEVHVMLSPHSPVRDPPEASELVTALQDLENSASADAATREKISSLPPEVSDTSLLARLQDRTSGQRLLAQVTEAMEMLTDYNGRLAGEMDERKRVTRLLQDFTQSQKDLLAQATRTLEEYRIKLEKVYLVREELKSHIQNLPDISKLPNVTGGFAPLPSAGDLFS